MINKVTSYPPAFWIGYLGTYFVMYGLLSLWWWHLLGGIWDITIPLLVFIPAGIIMLCFLPLLCVSTLIAVAIGLQLYLSFVL